jgi:hypothetical protein
VGAKVNPTYSERAPPKGAKTQRQDPLLALAETQSARIHPLLDLEARWELQQYVHAFGPVARLEPERNVEQVAFEGPLAIELDLDVDPRRAHLQSGNCCDECKRRRKENELRQPEHERGQQSECSKSGVCA